MRDTLPSMKCDQCGKDVPVGEWPWCPHGIPNGMLGQFRPYIDEHLGHEPVEIRSLAERHAHMKAAGLEYRSPKVGTKGCEI